MADKPLAPQEAAFVQEYVANGFKGSEAAKAAGYSEKGAKQMAWKLLQRPQIIEAIDKAKALLAERAKIQAEEIVSALADIARADPRELVEYLRRCCRYCHGAKHRYQRTAGEMERDREAWKLLTPQERIKRGCRTFDVKGGIGFNPKRDPHPDCPECFGDGIGEMFVHDTRTLSPQAAAMFAGVKQTRDGLEIKMHSAPDALVNLGRHLGIFNDKLDLTARVTGGVQYRANIPPRNTGGGSGGTGSAR